MILKDCGYKRCSSRRSLLQVRARTAVAAEEMNTVPDEWLTHNRRLTVHLGISHLSQPAILSFHNYRFLSCWVGKFPGNLLSTKCT